MAEKNSQEKVMQFAVSELMKIISDVQKGKTPKASAQVEALQKELEGLSSDMSEEEVEKWADKTVSKIEKK